MSKKMYLSVSDGYDVSNLILEVTNVIGFIECDEESRSEDDKPKNYIITPVWLTQEEYTKLPEFEG